MSRPPEDLESRLDTAFQASRPRPGFGDELWARIQSPARPRRRHWPAWAGLGRFDYAPALSGLLVVCIAAAGLFGLTHLPRSGGAARGASSGAQRPADLAAPPPQGASAAAVGQFGPLPRPALSNPRVSELSTETGALPYFDAADLSWTGSLPGLPPLLPVLRYAEPQKPEQDAFATKLGAAPAASPGTYQGPDFALALFGSNLANGREAIYAYTPHSTETSLNTPSEDAARKSASDFLAAKGLTPSWDGSKISVRGFNGLSVVHYVREFNVPGTADQAVQIDASGRQVGLDVLVKGDGSVFQASGPVPVGFDRGSYRALPSASVLQQLQRASTPGGPHVNLTTATLVYEALSDGDHGFYVPAVLFTGVFEQGGQRYEKRLLVQVLDPSGLR